MSTARRLRRQLLLVAELVEPRLVGVDDRRARPSSRRRRLLAALALDGARDRDARGHLELEEDVAQVRLDRLLAEKEGRADLLVRQPVADERGDLAPRGRSATPARRRPPRRRRPRGSRRAPSLRSSLRTSSRARTEPKRSSSCSACAQRRDRRGAVARQRAGARPSSMRANAACSGAPAASACSDRGRRARPPRPGRRRARAPPRRGSARASALRQVQVQRGGVGLRPRRVAIGGVDVAERELGERQALPVEARLDRGPAVGCRRRPRA